MKEGELEKEAIKYAVDYPTSYGKGYKHKDLRIAYLAGAEPREKRIAKLENLIHAERKRQEQCNDIHLRTIAELEKENAELRAKYLQATDEGTSWAHLKSLEKENAELKERHAEILEAFASASSGDDLEMAESAREIMEILNIPCYRHGKVVSKLTKAKELLKEWIIYRGGTREFHSALQDKTEEFLKEVEE